MMSHQSNRADDGGVLRIAMAALLLIVAGLGLWAWDNQANIGAARTHSVLQHP